MTWGAGNGQRQLSLKGHRDRITSVAYSPDGKRLASASEDQTIKIWEVSTGLEITMLHEDQPAFSLAFSPDGLRLASGSVDGTVKLWAPPGQGPRVMSRESRMLHVAFSPDGQRLVGGGRGVVIWDVQTGNVLQRAAGRGEGNRVEWSPDGRYLAAGAHGELWDTGTGITMGALKVPPREQISGYGFAFSRDGTRFAACVSKSVYLWNTADGKLSQTFLVNTIAPSTCVTFSPDGRLLAAGWGLTTLTSPVGALGVWNVTTGQEVFRFDGFRRGVWKVAFSPDGNRLAVATGPFRSSNTKSPQEPGTVRLWDTTTWAAIATLRGHSACVWGLAFSPDSRRLASAAGLYGPGKNSGEVIIWDTVTWQELITLGEHASGVFGVAFSPCGRRIATATYGGTVTIWDGTPLAETPERGALPAPQ
jgi:WD40 repeat protein